jgi:hypothetical protein
MEKAMEDDYRILAEQERDRLMELHCRAEHAAFNVIEGLNELNRIEAEGAFKLHQAFAECIAAIDAASAKLRNP